MSEEEKSNKYQMYPDKSLVAAYIFAFPTDDPEDREALLSELERRGFAKLARQLFSELHDTFTDKWLELEGNDRQK